MKPESFASEFACQGRLPTFKIRIPEACSVRFSLGDTYSRAQSLNRPEPEAAAHPKLIQDESYAMLLERSSVWPSCGSHMLLAEVPRAFCSDRPA